MNNMKNFLSGNNTLEIFEHAVSPRPPYIVFDENGRPKHTHELTEDDSASMYYNRMFGFFRDVLFLHLPDIKTTHINENIIDMNIIEML